MKIKSIILLLLLTGLAHINVYSQLLLVNAGNSTAYARVPAYGVGGATTNCAEPTTFNSGSVPNLTILSRAIQKIAPFGTFWKPCNSGPTYWWPKVNQYANNAFNGATNQIDIGWLDTNYIASVDLLTGKRLPYTVNRSDFNYRRFLDFLKDFFQMEFFFQSPIDCENETISGMPIWQVSEPYISLWINDEPLGYQPALGPRISCGLYFKQRETTNGFNTNIFSIGKRWNFSWLGYVTSNAGTNTVNLPGGGSLTFLSTNDYLTHTRLVGDTTSGFTLYKPDGSKDVYGFVVTNNLGAFQQAFLSEQWNTQLGKILFQYESYDPTNPVIRLQYVIDGDGRTNSISYTNNSFSTNLISEVTDPFERSTLLRYDSTGNLTNIIDVIGISNSLAYDTNSWITNLITPYGTTSFLLTEEGSTNDISGRSVLITEPDGSKQLYLFTNNAAGVANTYPTNEIPVTPITNTFETNNLKQLNSFHWGRRQYANLSTTNIPSFTTNDFRLARMRHWLKSFTAELGNTISLERLPSPSVSGSIEGQKIWYDYAGKAHISFEGTQVIPSIVATVLPNGETQLKLNQGQNWIGLPKTNITTYSSNNVVLYRTNTFAYGTNEVDLIAATNALGIRVSSNYFNAYRQILTNYNASSEVTSFTYNTNQRPTSLTLPSGLVTTNIYGSDNFLATQIDIGFATNSFTWSNDLIYVHTDMRGLTVTHTWDALQRPTSLAFSDGTYISNSYTILDLTATKDRLDNWTYFGFDSLRHNTSITNALGYVTLFDYCSCGSLNSLRDAQTNFTYFYRDNLGQATNIVYPDGYSVTNCFDLLGRVTNTVDSAGTSVTNWFNNQGLQIAVSNAFGQVQLVKYDILDRVTNSMDANGVTVATTFDNLNRPLTRSYPDSGLEKWGYTVNFAGPTSYTNQLNKVTRFGYDAALRKTSETNANLEVTRFTFNGANDLLTLEDGKNQVTTWVLDEFGRATNKWDAATNLVLAQQFDANGRVTNRWTPAKGTTLLKYDPLNNLTNIDYTTSPDITFEYDSLNRMTNMSDAVGTTKFSWNSVGQLLSEDGTWSNDTVSYGYANRQRSSLTLLQPNASAWAQTYAYDLTKRMTNVISPAGSFDYAFDATRQTQVKKLTLPNDAYITNNFDGNARLLGTVLKNSSDAILNSHLYQVNVGNQRTAMTNFAGDYRNYTYDDIGQLQTASGYESGGTARLNEKLGYAYDAAHNLNQRTNNALVQTFNVNNLNELTSATRSGTLTVAGTTTSAATNVSVNTLTASLYGDNTFAKDGFTVADGNNTFTAIAQDTYNRKDTNAITVNLPATNNFVYDLNGNLLTNGTQILEYDDENQLVTNYVPASWKSEFTYDGLNRRRIEKDYTWQGGAWVKTNETHLVWDGNVILQERDANNIPTVTYTRGNDLSGSLQAAGGIGGVLARNSATETAFYHADGNGNITALIGTNQLIVARYGYDSFGNVLFAIGWLAEPNTMQFSSMPKHHGLVLFLRRAYDPILQRWLIADPLGVAADTNPFRFVLNNPISHADPFGLDTYYSHSATIFGINLPYAEVPYRLPSNPRNFIDQAEAIAALPAVGILNGLNLFNNAMEVSGANELLMALPPNPGTEVEVGIAAILARVSKCTKVETTALFRAVNEAELTDLGNNSGVFRNLGSAEGKYFSTTAEGAASYARQTFGTGLYEGPYTIVTTAVPTSSLTPNMAATVDSGISTIVIPNNLLPGLTPGKALPFTPIPKQ